MKKILKRFGEILKPDFLKNLSQEESQKTTWKFWFFYNAIIAMIISVVAIFALGKALNNGMDYVAKNFPDAKIAVENGKLSTEGLNEPVFHEDGNESVFVIDTKNEKYDASILDKYKSGIFIGADRVYNKKSSIEVRSYDISKIGKNFSITQNNLHDLVKNNTVKIFSVAFLFVFGTMLLFFGGLKLISALWWALVFWVLALILGIKEMNFKNTYYGVLNFYFIIFLWQMLLMWTGVLFAFSTTLIFLILFGINFWKMKKVPAPVAIEAEESKIESENKDGVVETKNNI